MRYKKKLKLIEGIPTYDIIKLQYEAINEECDKYSKFIADTDLISLMRSISIYYMSVEMTKIRNYSIHGVHTEIVREHIRGSSKGSSNDIPKLVKAYEDLFLFIANVLDPIITGDPCEVMVEGDKVYLKYDPDFLQIDAETNRKIEMQNEHFLNLYELITPNLGVDPLYTFNRVMRIQLEKSPWIYTRDERLADYDRKNASLLSVFADIINACDASLDPIIVQNRQNLINLERFSKEELQMLDLLIFDIDNAKPKDSEEFDIVHKPIIKIKGQYIYSALLCYQLQYVESVYTHIKKSDDDIRFISAFMADLIRSHFAEIKDTISFSNQKFYIDSQKNGDFDCFIVDTKSKCAVLIEYKHSREFRRDAKGAKKFKENNLTHEKKGFNQIKRYLEYIHKDSGEIERSLGLEDGVLKDIEIYPLIVSNSMEHDGNDPIKKISYFELQTALSRDGTTLPRFIQIIKQNEVWRI
ncbi:MAG: hypothetical protein LBV09_06730 [Deferribacteraceae bacterium]|jgi:hypothetical protein|nr:hypothetical protein [Deferribacteraceae bacterium]